MGAPCAFAKPAVTLQVYSGTASSAATASSNCSTRSSSGVSTVMMGWCELTRRRSSSCLSWRRAGGFACAEASVLGACVTVCPEGTAFGSFDKGKGLVYRYRSPDHATGALDGTGTGYQSKAKEEV